MKMGSRASFQAKLKLPLVNSFISGISGNNVNVNKDEVVWGAEPP